jgi:uncharacterized protein YecE (DUF72 family)
MRVHVGTSGYSYPAWKGHFYPEKLAAKDMLRYYAERFRTVEINNTFYRMPNEAMLRKWGEEAPAGFAYALKASRRITHDKRLNDVADSTDYLFRAAGVLGEKLGPFLFQLPPNFKKDIERLRGFLKLVPPDRRAAMEFRHVSWFDDETFAALKEARVALCLADTGEPDDAPAVATADWGYLRLRREAYGDADLASWAEKVCAMPWSDAFVYFKHEDEGKGPKLAAQFEKLLA